MYTTIFLQENEKDIFQALKAQGIKTKVFEHRLAELFNRVYNNYVGYYVFKQDSIVYKMIVLPKTIEPSKNAEKEFVDYLLHYYRIKNTYKDMYKKKKEKIIPNSLLQLAFESNNSSDSSHDFLEDFQSHRYMAILQDIENFFKRHKNSKRVKMDYISQSIKHTLNLKRNIKELDKTKIHQIQSKDVVFSMLATVAYNALKLFIEQKYSGTHGDKLFKEVKKVQSMLLKKYKIERGYKLSIATLQGLKLVKLFSKTEENKQLLVDIKSLFGFEQMYKDDKVSIDYRQDLTTTSLFINPIDFYEWYVYDILKKYADNNGKTIQFDKKEGTTTQYSLNRKPKSSKPDYILTDIENSTKVVIDAKWKVVKEFGDVQPSDYLKLKFDSSLIEIQGGSVSSYLIYPKIEGMDELGFNMRIDDKTVFDFDITEVNMDVTNLSKGLDFNFDVKKLQDSIEENTKVKHLKTMSEELSASISKQRTSTLSKLINEEDNDKKEDLRATLDEQLSQASQNLSEKIEEQKILPEIEEILTKYDLVLEDESKKFLKSSSVIYGYYKEKSYEHFDYSMPGSGFWKLIELELNTSFVKYIRLKKGVIDKKDCWKPILDKDDERNINWVKLNDWDLDGNLKGLMFGQLKFLSRNRHVKSLFNGIVNYNFEKQWELLDRVSIFRNEHAHIKAMSLEDFEKLWKLLFDRVDDKYILLEELLDFKKNIRDFIETT